MNSNLLRGVAGLAALVLSIALVADANACGTCGGATTTFYQPATAYYQPAAYTTAYAPAYTSYYGGSSWYPGYWLDRVSQNIWGSPTTYVAAYQPAYSVGYATGYAAPACSSCSTCSTCTAGYAPCSSCAQTVTLRPVCGCSDCGSTCSSCSGGGCSSCGSGVVNQAVYQQPSGCTSCGQPATVVPSSTTVIVPGTQQIVVPQSGSPAGSSPSPELAPGDQVPSERTFQKPPANGQGELQPEPADESAPAQTPATDSSVTPQNGTLNGDSNAKYFEAPKLFNPNDRTATRVAAPVWKAVYERPVTTRQISTGPITEAQAERDAAGWTSASK